MFSYYDINFYRLADWLTPRWMRKQRFLIILRACLYPLVLIHNSFIRYREAKLYEMAMNYQVCYMEAFLNDRFDFIGRGIFIEDSLTVTTLYIFKRAEANPVWLYTRPEDIPVHVYTRGELMGNLTIDFIVWVPVGVPYDEAEMRAMIATKLCGKRYTIQTF